MCDYRVRRQQHHCPELGHPSTHVPGMFGDESETGLRGKHNNQLGGNTTIDRREDLGEATTTVSSPNMSSVDVSTRIHHE